MPKGFNASYSRQERCLEIWYEDMLITNLYLNKSRTDELRITAKCTVDYVLQLLVLGSSFALSNQRVQLGFATGLPSL